VFGTLLLLSQVDQHRGRQEGGLGSVGTGEPEGDKSAGVPSATQPGLSHIRLKWKRRWEANKGRPADLLGDPGSWMAGEGPAGKRGARGVCLARAQRQADGNPGPSSSVRPSSTQSPASTASSTQVAAELTPGAGETRCHPEDEGEPARTQTVPRKLFPGGHQATASPTLPLLERIRNTEPVSLCRWRFMQRHPWLSPAQTRTGEEPACYRAE
jgi:hypothetical protein